MTLVFLLSSDCSGSWKQVINQRIFVSLVFNCFVLATLTVLLWIGCKKTKDFNWRVLEKPIFSLFLKGRAGVFIQLCRKRREPGCRMMVTFPCFLLVKYPGWFFFFQGRAANREGKRTRVCLYSFSCVLEKRAFLSSYPEDLSSIYYSSSPFLEFSSAVSCWRVFSSQETGVDCWWYAGAFIKTWNQTGLPTEFKHIIKWWKRK